MEKGKPVKEAGKKKPTELEYDAKKRRIDIRMFGYTDSSVAEGLFTILIKANQAEISLKNFWTFLN